MQLQFIQKYSRNLNLDKVRSVRTDNFDNRKHVAKIFIQMTFDQVGNLPFWCSGLYSWTFFRFITFIRICFMGIIVLLIESMFVIVHQSGRERKVHFGRFSLALQKNYLGILGPAQAPTYSVTYEISYFNPNPPVPVSLPLHSVSLHTNKNQRQKFHKHVAYSS